MKKSDYDEIITKLSNPDLQADGLVELSEKLAADETAFNEMSKSIDSLRDTNAKLALRITTPLEAPKEEDKTPPEPTLEDLMDKLREDIGIGGNSDGTDKQ